MTLGKDRPNLIHTAKTRAHRGGDKGSQGDRGGVAPRNLQKTLKNTPVTYQGGTVALGVAGKKGIDVGQYILGVFILCVWGLFGYYLSVVG